MRILFLTNIPSPYRIDFFNELGKSVELTVVFEAKTALGIRFNWNIDQINNFKAIFLSEGNINEKKVDWSILKHIKKNYYNHIFVTNYAYFTETIALLILKFRRISYYLEIDGGLIRKENKLKKFLKKILISNAMGYFSPSKSSDEYLMIYGAKKDKIIRYPFTSIYRKEILDKPVESEEKKYLKDKLGIAEEKTILSVGQFIHRKGFDLLLQVATQLKEKNIGFYFVGGEATSEYMDIKNKEKLESVHFVGFKSKDELVEYYKAMDIFVLPTRGDVWGLVINEAMACGLPIITTDRCIAGLELVENGVNGYIVPVENIEELKNKIENLVINPEKCKEMSKNNLNLMENYTIEEMSKEHWKTIKI